MTEKTINLEPNKEEDFNEEKEVVNEEEEDFDEEDEDFDEENEFNKEEALEYLVWCTLLNLDKFGSISFVRLYKELNLTPSSEIWVGPKICWTCAQSPEFRKLLQKKGRSYQISRYGKEVLEILSRKYGDQFKIEHAYKLYEISERISVKELKEYVKSISEEA
jgi:hypothetical protein